MHIKLTNGSYEVTDLVEGDTVTEVLNYVQFRANDLIATFRRKVANAKDLSRTDANAFIADYLAGLEGYTYLEGDVPAGWKLEAERAESKEQRAESKEQRAESKEHRADSKAQPEAV